MKRLVDSDSAAQPQLERLARWLERVEPIADDADRRRRVRLAMQQPERGGWRLGRGALSVVLLLVAGVAAAAGHQLLRPAGLAKVESPPVAPTAPVAVAAPPAAKAGPISAANEKAPAAAPSPSAAAAPLAGAVPSARVAPPRVAKRLAAAAPSGDDPGTRLMVEAMQARSAGQYSRALALLTEYQRRFPGGALQDEALALQVEMSSLQGSSERSRALGRAYLTRFPNGRYRAWVSQSLAAAEP